MNWAVKDGIRITAQPELKGANCPLCKEEVIAKCGTIKVWHWSHKADNDCDSWGEGETEWHLNWKNQFPKEQQEVVVGEHRADIKNSKGIVIELQSSSISSDEINEREEFYGDMIWLIDGDKFANNLLIRSKGNYFSFRWKHPPKSWWYANKNVYVDLSYRKKIWDKVASDKYNELMEIKSKNKDNHGAYLGKEYDLEMEFKTAQDMFERYNSKDIFFIKKIHPRCPCGGWGILISKEEFLKQYR